MIPQTIVKITEVAPWWPHCPEAMLLCGAEIGAYEEERQWNMYRVVIADDSAAYLAWLKSLLESSQDFKVISEATDGAEGLHAVEAHLPDLVLADVEMPEMDGIDMAKIIARQWPDIGVILISSNNEPFYYQAAKESSALAFILKNDLSLATIQQVLREAGRQ